MGTGAKCVKGKPASERKILKALLTALLAKELLRVWTTAGQGCITLLRQLMICCFYGK